MNEYLGNESKSANQSKVYYLLIIFASYLVMFFMYLGSTSAAQKSSLWFFIWFGVLLGLLPILFDFVVNNGKELPLDTVSFEENSPLEGLNNFKKNLVWALILGLVVFFFIKSTDQAFVKAPEFRFAIPTLSADNNEVVGAFVSGLTAGVSESLVFFGFVFVTLYALLNKLWKAPLVLVLGVATLAASLLFMGYHFWVYSYQPSALLSVFLFGISQCILIYYFRSTSACITTHFFNNFAVILFSVVTFTIQSTV